METTWISVKDRLPENEHRTSTSKRKFSIRCLFTDGEVIYAGWREEIVGEKVFWCETSDTGDPIDDSRITHWCINPLLP